MPSAFKAFTKIIDAFSVSRALLAIGVEINNPIITDEAPQKTEIPACNPKIAETSNAKTKEMKLNFLIISKIRVGKYPILFNSFCIFQINRYTLKSSIAKFRILALFFL